MWNDEPELLEAAQEVDVFLASIFLPNNVGIKDVLVTLGDLGKNDVLLGMDIISNGDFSITNYGGKTRWTFRIPPVSDINFVEEINEQKKVEQANKQNKIGRNDPCPCGLGLKYKRCHGR